MKSKEAEQKAINELWKQYKESGNQEFRDQLIVQYLYLVKYVVGRIAAGLPAHVKIDDLYSSGVTGLIKSVEKFDINKNNKFETYAILVIKGAIIDELRALDWIPRSIHQKANRIAAAQHNLQQELKRDPTDSELSQYLGISEEDLKDILCRIRPAILIPLNAEISEDDETKSSISERIPDLKAEISSEIVDRKEFHSLLAKAISHLSEQERKVLMLYYYEEMILREIGEILGVSESRVSQIHTKAILKLRNRLRSLADEFVNAF